MIIIQVRCDEINESLLLAEPRFSTLSQNVCSSLTDTVPFRLQPREGTGNEHASEVTAPTLLKTSDGVKGAIALQKKSEVTAI